MATTLNGSADKATLVLFLTSLARYEDANGSGHIAELVEELTERVTLGEELTADDVTAIAQEVQSFYMEVE